MLVVGSLVIECAATHKNVTGDGVGRGRAIQAQSASADCGSSGISVDSGEAQSSRACFGEGIARACDDSAVGKCLACGDIDRAAAGSERDTPVRAHCETSRYGKSAAVQRKLVGDHASGCGAEAGVRTDGNCAAIDGRLSAVGIRAGEDQRAGALFSEVARSCEVSRKSGVRIVGTHRQRVACNVEGISTCQATEIVGVVSCHCECNHL